jgi:hypothetical protein
MAQDTRRCLEIAKMNGKFFWVRQLLHFYSLKNFIGGDFRFGRRR